MTTSLRLETEALLMRVTIYISKEEWELLPDERKENIKKRLKEGYGIDLEIENDEN